jgi:hypothetical protein
VLTCILNSGRRSWDTGSFAWRQSLPCSDAVVPVSCWKQWKQCAYAVGFKSRGAVLAASMFSLASGGCAWEATSGEVGMCVWSGVILYLCVLVLLA